MLVVDSSAVVSVALGEDAADGIIAALERSAQSEMSIANVVETAIVLRRRSDLHHRELRSLLETLRITPVAVDEAQLEAALDAGVRYGRGTGHRAQLNYGDCFAYALAKVRGAPLLFVGEDFSRTDVEAALG